MPDNFEPLPGSPFGKGFYTSADYHKSQMGYAESLDRAQKTYDTKMRQISQSSVDSMKQKMIHEGKAARDQAEMVKKVGGVHVSFVDSGMSATFASSSPQGAQFETFGSSVANEIIKDTHRVINAQFRDKSRVSSINADSKTYGTKTLATGYGDRNDSSE